jgi:hypothetical protein
MEELQTLGQKLLDTAVEYNILANKIGMYGAVIWLSGTDGELVIITRGEYKDRLLYNIERTGPTRYFGHTVEEV